jgi:hypothetical protein
MGLRPSELCSSRAAVRRLRRRSPPAVGFSLTEPDHPNDLDRRSGFRRKGPITPVPRPPKRPRTSWPSHRRNGSQAVSPRAAEATLGPWAFRPPRRPSDPDDQPRPELPPKRSTQSTAHSTSLDIPKHLELPPSDDPALQERPRLQGFAPHESPPLEHQLFRPASGAWLSWAFCPPGLSPSLACRGLHRDSPHGLLSRRRERPRERVLQGLAPSEVGWALSSLPTLMGFFAS